MALNPLPLPTDTPLVEPNAEGALLINFLWLQTFVARDQQLAQSATRLTNPLVTLQAASIAATPLSIGTNAGLYRVNLVARITRAATVSSSLTVTIRWTMGGVALSKTYTALTGNTTATYLAEIFPVRLDAATALTYETVYASSGATTMEYSAEIAVERLA